MKENYIVINGNTSSSSNKKQAKERLEKVKKRLDLYYNREEEMLSGGVQSYGLGTRNVSRYNTELETVRATIKELEKEKSELEKIIAGGSRRRSMACIPKDW